MKKDSEYYELAETIVNSLNDVQVDTQEAISIVAHVLYEKDLSQTQQVSDEEIHDKAQEYNAEHSGGGQSFQDGAKWLRSKSVDNKMVEALSVEKDGLPKEDGRYIVKDSSGWFDCTFGHGKFVSDIINPPDKNGSWRNEIKDITHYFKAEQSLTEAKEQVKEKAWDNRRAFTEGFEYHRTHAPQQKLTEAKVVEVVEIDFGGHVKARIVFDNGEFKVTDAMNGYGNPIEINKIEITGKEGK